MRQVLTDLARKRKTVKRGENAKRVMLEETLKVNPNNIDQILQINDAIERLVKLNPRQGKVVDLRLFAGLKFETIAENLAISLATVKRNWNIAKAWLSRELGENSDVNT